KNYWRSRRLNANNNFNERYEEFLLDLGVTSEYKYDTSDLDMVVIGSDEVFNCLQSNPDVGYSRDLFGYSSKAKRLISYAGSFGSTTIEKLEEYNCKNEVADMFKKFDDISVRDNNSGEIIKELINMEPSYNVDPVFLYDFSDYIKDVDVKLDNYIVVYAYGGRITQEEQVEIKKLAKKYNKKLVSIGTVQDFCDINIVLSPFELLAYVKNADFVITDTFHGSVFSIKYNKKFATIIRESNKQKLGDLLKRFGVYDRRVEDIGDLEFILNEEINYDEVNKVMDRKINESKLYLAKNIKNITE
ncbi:MAG: polysaccharide pyruvyl transferase family protein, partial [Intestinibacter sp.]|uniref:polysaccharide pyruvyl transferase family protein n=1 Tax=Intestinibacter sp. TaxID=1965304 RepID=UPI003F165757